MPDVAAGTTVRAHGLSVTVPEGWECRIWRPEPGTVEGATTNPVLHAASTRLPEVRGDFGGGVVERLAPDGVFLALLEYDREATASPLFARRGLPGALSGSHFQTHTLQRAVAGQSGAQRFFQEAGRAFSLYVVLGSHADRWRLATAASRVLRTIEVV